MLAVVGHAFNTSSQETNLAHIVRFKPNGVHWETLSQKRGGRIVGIMWLEVSSSVAWMYALQSRYLEGCPGSIIPLAQGSQQYSL